MSRRVKDISGLSNTNKKDKKQKSSVMIQYVVNKTEEDKWDMKSGKKVW